MMGTVCALAFLQWNGTAAEKDGGFVVYPVASGSTGTRAFFTHAHVSAVVKAGLAIGNSVLATPSAARFSKSFIGSPFADSVPHAPLFDNRQRA